MQKKHKTLYFIFFTIQRAFGSRDEDKADIICSSRVYIDFFQKRKVDIFERVEYILPGVPVYCFIFSGPG